MSILKVSRAVGASLTALSMVVLSGGPAALAANVTVGGSNSVTGANSSNTSTTTVLDDALLTINNLASSLNSLQLTFDNGGNTVANNTTIGGFSSGDINAIGSFTTRLNNDPIMVAGAMSPSNVTGIFRNDTTGSSSLNTNSLNVTNNQTTSVNNLAAIDNEIGLTVDTGGNNILNNTTVGPVSIGGANIGLNVNNSANQGASSMLMPSLPSNVVVSGGNSTTGANSLNSNDVNVANTKTTVVNNTSTITNVAGVTANTGGNTIDSNTTVGAVHTGGVTANLSFTNSAN